MRENNIRVKIDDRNEKLGYKIREAQIKKIPINLILGDKEKESRTISYRLYSENDTTTLSIDEFIKYLSNRIKDKK